jgi:hypothetical protein
MSFQGLAEKFLSISKTFWHLFLLMRAPSIDNMLCWHAGILKFSRKITSYFVNFDKREFQAYQNFGLH